MTIAVLGAGAWGTALSLSVCDRRQTRLWVRDPAQLQAMQASRSNARYLSGIALPPSLQLTCDFEQAISGADLIILATPIAGVRGLLERLATSRAVVAWLCKGFEAPRGTEHGLMVHEIRARVAPELKAGVLSGPSFALEVARGQPTALVAASADPQVRDRLVEAFHSATMRIYANEDVVGVEVGGAVKNVLAIATGLCDGMYGGKGLGLNARAALITRGLSEMTRLGLALGAHAETFMGLSGLGDLVLTATGDLSRNRRVGYALAQGLSLEQAVASLGHVAEGVNCARTVVLRARELGVEMPIAESVLALLNGELDPAQAIRALMQREAKAEA